VTELKTLLGDYEDGQEKKDLEKVLAKATAHVKDLEEHIALGTKLIG